MRLIMPLMLALLATPVIAQVGLPRSLPQVGLPSLGDVQRQLGETVGDARALVAQRTGRLRDFLRDNRETVEADDRGAAAVRGEIVAMNLDAPGERALLEGGFTLIAREEIDGLGIAFARFRIPRGDGLARALRDARRAAPGADISADTLHFQTGAATPATASAIAQGRANGAVLGLIDGGVARHPSLTAPVEQRGFARGAPAPSAHGTAVASLIAGNGRVRGGAPGASLRVADVYGRDPAGGGAVAIARALGWLAARGTRITTVSLVGPSNPLLAAAVAAAQKRGMTIVAAVGNDGPAARPGYPAGYPGVIAVTAVDRRMRVLPEAQAAVHVDFAAPGADIRAAGLRGRSVKVRGTSYAAPLVAGALSRAGSRGTLAATAERASKATGAGIVCADCPAR
jgi:subtilisin family serine protease